MVSQGSIQAYNVRWYKTPWFDTHRWIGYRWIRNEWEFMGRDQNGGHRFKLRTKYYTNGQKVQKLLEEGIKQ